MRAWRYVGRGLPLERQEIAEPRPGPGEALVRVLAAGLCHSDLHIIEEDWNYPIPLTLGHESVGEVVSVGPNAGGLTPGQHVAIHCANPCGECRWCREGRENVCQSGKGIGLQIDGAFADYLVCRTSALVPVPDGVSLEAAAVSTDAVLTPYHAIHGVGRLRRGEEVAIFGCGGLGLNAVQIAKAAGARVIAIDPIEEKRALALDLGADDAIADGSLLTTQRVDAIFDFVGKDSTVLDAQMGVRIGGRVVLVGIAAVHATLVAIRFGAHEISLLGAYSGTTDELRACLQMLAQGHVRPVLETAPLDSINEQLDRLRRGEILGRAVLIP